MRKHLLLFIPGLAICTMAFVKSDVFTDLQITEEQVKTEVLNSLNADDFYIPYNEMAKRLSPEARTLAVNALATFAKNYYNSEDFLYDYIGATEVEEENFEAIDDDLDMQFAASQNYSVESQYATVKETIAYLKQMQDSPYIGETEKAELKKQIELAEKEVAKMEANHKKDQIKATNEGKEKNKAAYAKSKETLKQKEIEQNERLQKQEIDKARATKESKQRLIIRLEDFLAFTADINFDAKLVEGKGGKLYFADPELEAKDEQWKRFFRAGKEPVAAARQFAQEWLKELK